MLKRIDKEILFGGIFGIIAIVAAIGEMIANGVSAATVLGSVKDIAGTLVAVMVFIIAVRHLFVKKATDFDGAFNSEMEKIVTKYSPIISKDNNVAGRYNIASNYNDCGVMIFDKATQDTHSGGSGCACCATVFSGYWFKQLKEKKIKKILLIATGALMNSTSSQQGESIPGIAHAISIEV